MPAFLVPDTVARQDGVSAEVSVGERGKPVVLTLGITRILEQETLEVSVWGSPDRQKWRFVGAFPHKSYCGTYSMTVDLARNPDVEYLRVEWKMARWGQNATAPLFGFYVFVEQPKVRRAGAA
jgi:hypothetical protein